MLPYQIKLVLVLSIGHEIMGPFCFGYQLNYAMSQEICMSITDLKNIFCFNCLFSFCTHEEGECRNVQYNNFVVELYLTNHNRPCNKSAAK